MAKQTELKQAQLDGYKRKVTIKYQKDGATSGKKVTDFS